MKDRNLDDTARGGDTQPLKPVGVRQRPPEPPKRKRGDPPSGGGGGAGALSIPAWAIGVMLLLVFGIAVGIVTLVLMLGGQTEPGGEPRIIIVTAPPTPTSDQPPTAQFVPGAAATATLPGDVPVFALEGPTLPPIIFTPTPLTITVGAAVLVNIEGLNVRAEPGLQGRVVFNASLNAGFNVVGGPTQADGLTWWQVQDPGDPSRAGWAAADYLDVFAP